MNTAKNIKLPATKFTFSFFCVWTKVLSCLIFHFSNCVGWKLKLEEAVLISPNRKFVYGEMELSASSPVPQEGLEALLTSITRSKYWFIVRGVECSSSLCWENSSARGAYSRKYHPHPMLSPLSQQSVNTVRTCIPIPSSPQEQVTRKLGPHSAISALILMEKGRIYSAAKGKALHGGSRG